MPEINRIKVPHNMVYGILAQYLSKPLFALEGLVKKEHPEELPLSRGELLDASGAHFGDYFAKRM